MSNVEQPSYLNADQQREEITPLGRIQEVMLVTASGAPVPTTQPVLPVDSRGFAATRGGSVTVGVPAGTTANTVVKATPGRLCRVLVTATGTAAVTFYDSGTTASGTVIGYLAANSAAGTVLDCDLPAAVGITIAGNAANPGLTVSYS